MKLVLYFALFLMTSNAKAQTTVSHSPDGLVPVTGAARSAAAGRWGWRPGSSASSGYSRAAPYVPPRVQSPTPPISQSTQSLNSYNSQQRAYSEAERTRAAAEEAARRAAEDARRAQDSRLLWETQEADRRARSDAADADFRQRQAISNAAIYSQYSLAKNWQKNFKKAAVKEIKDSELFLKKLKEDQITAFAKANEDLDAANAESFDTTIIQSPDFLLAVSSDHAASDEYQGLGSDQAVLFGGLQKRLLDIDPVFEFQKDAKTIGFAALSEAYVTFLEGNKPISDRNLEIAQSMADLALGLTPGVGWAKDIYEATTGKSFVTGKKLDSISFGLAMIGAVTIGFGSDLAIVARNIDRFGPSLKTITVRGFGVLGESFDSAFTEAKVLFGGSQILGHYHPMNVGPLHNALFSDGGPVAKSFFGSTYVWIKLDQPIYVYRVSNDPPIVGRYWTLLEPKGSLQAKLDLALIPAYQNSAKTMMQMKIPAGTEVFFGRVAPQFDEAAQVTRPGGGYQVYLQKDPPANWVEQTRTFK